MKLRATTWSLLVLLLLGQNASAQTVVTIRQLNTLPPAGLAVVKAKGAAVTAADMAANIRSPYFTAANNADPAKMVTITGVVLSDPRYSGLSSVSNGTVSRIHFFVRDVTAAVDGPAGNDLQVVDGNYATSGTLGLFVGDVVKMTGNLAYFGTGVQFSPISVEVLGTYADRGLPATILNPVTVTIDQLNMVTGDLKIRINWDNLSALNQQYVRIENVQVWQSPNRADSRPNWAVRDLTTGAIIQNDDMSLAYRNDKSDYTSEFFATNNFTAPPAGATVNLQGFALLRTNFNPFQIGDPAAAVLKIVPWTPADLVMTASPPNITQLVGPAGVPGNAPVAVQATITPDGGLIIATAEVRFTSSSNPTERSISGTGDANNRFTFEIPELPDGDFVTWYVAATDNGGFSAMSATQSYRVLHAGINDIRDIQTTQSGGRGPSPFTGLTINMNVLATIMVNPSAVEGSSGLLALQDGIGLFDGITVRSQNNPLAARKIGDVIRITRATIAEAFDLTQLRDIQYEFVSEGLPYASILVPTGVLKDLDIAESLEGMLVRVETVDIVSTNADGTAGNFGEFLVSSDNTVGNGLRVNDVSSFIAWPGNDAGAVLSAGQTLDFVQGILWYSFSNFKLEPRFPEDIGAVVNVATEGNDVPQAYALYPAYPNPFNPTTTLRFDVASAGDVSLTVYDALGRLVDTLVSGHRAAGTHTVNFEASSLPSGLYVYRLETTQGSASRSMMLVK